MTDTKIYKHLHILIERAGEEKGTYAIITKEPLLRNDLWLRTCKALTGFVRNATHSSCEIKLTNGTLFMILVTNTKNAPRWLTLDGIHFDRSFD